MHMLHGVLFVFLTVSSFLSLNSYGQTPTDDSIFAAKIKQAKAEKIDTLPIGERVAAMGKLFLGTPYVAGTLDVDTSKEQLVVNLRGFDCVTTATCAASARSFRHTKSALPYVSTCCAVLPRISIFCFSRSRHTLHFRGVLSPF